MNKLMISGHLGQDPQLNYAPSGDAICKFSVAVNRLKKANGEERPPIWVGCTAWGKQGEVIAQYFKKGDKILTIGEMDLYVNENDGKAYLQQTVREFEFMNGKKENSSTAKDAEKAPPIPEDLPKKEGVTPADNPDDLPF